MEKTIWYALVRMEPRDKNYPSEGYPISIHQDPKHFDSIIGQTPNGTIWKVIQVSPLD